VGPSIKSDCTDCDRVGDTFVGDHPVIMSEKYVFIRNPKTASTSWANSLQSVDPQAHRLGGPHNILHDTMKELPKVRAVVVRNPYDRIVSLWFGQGAPGNMLSWLTKKSEEPSGPGLDIMRVPQMAWANQCNRVMRFENIEHEYEDFCLLVGLDHKPLMFKNKSDGRDGAHYRDVLSSVTRRIVEDRFAPDFYRFKYEW